MVNFSWLGYCKSSPTYLLQRDDSNRNKWFPDSERSLVTSICGLSIPGGNLVAFLLSGLIFAGVEEMTASEVQGKMNEMLWV